MSIAGLILVLVLQANPSTNSCWTTIAPRIEYGSSDQARDLQRRVKASCDVVALAWTTTVLPQQRSLLVWDTKQQTLFRIHVEQGVARWEKWAGMSRERVVALNASDGFGVTAYTSGKGRAGLSAGAIVFVTKNAPKRFDPAL